MKSLLLALYIETTPEPKMSISDRKMPEDDNSAILWIVGTLLGASLMANVVMVACVVRYRKKRNSSNISAAKGECGSLVLMSVFFFLHDSPRLKEGG